MPNPQTATNINEYTDGTTVRVPFQFEDYQGNPIDPTTVEFQWAVAPSYGGPLGSATTYTSTDIPPATSAPAIAHVARLAEGSFEVWLDTTGLPGYWTCQPVGIGVGQALPGPPEHVFRVVARAIPTP